MSATITLPAIKRSPATLQYHIKNTRPTKFYIPQFRLDPADRAKTIGAEWFRETDPMMPAYPFGPDIRYPEANEGLYGGMSIRSGNKISKGRNKGRTLRKWFPNAKVEKIKSEALDKELTLPITSRVMRTIRKVGGLDQYVTGTKPARIKGLGLLGWKLRWLVINSQKWKQEYQQQQSALSPAAAEVQNPLDETFEDVWNAEDGRKRSQLVSGQYQKWKQLEQKDKRFRQHHKRDVLFVKSRTRIPGLSTLTSLDPHALRLGNARVEEAEGTRRISAASDVS